MTTMKVAIIGAGASGLASARRALEYGVHIVVFEESDHIGGIWVYSEESAGSSSPIYENLRVNLPVQLMEFTGYKFEAQSGLCYPYHDDVLKYINAFADHYDLRRFIKFRTRVVEIRRLEDEWRVSVKNLLENSLEQYSFDAVMVCNGHNSVPYVPHIPGQEMYSGPIIHSRVYRRNTSFEGKRVLIVGHGISGKEIAAECCKVATEVTLSCRCKPWPCKVTLDETKVKVKPQIKFIKDKSIFFEDNVSLDVDAIILCTGYLYDIPFVHESCGVKIREGKFIEPLYKGFINITQPSMCFIGCVGGIFLFQLFDLQAEVFIKHLTGCIQLPNPRTMMESLRKDIDRKERALIPMKRYFIEENAEEYCGSLFRLGNIKPFPPVLFKIFHENISRYERRLQTKYPPTFEITDDESFLCYENDSP